jgi:hypothetical protein
MAREYTSIYGGVPADSMMRYWSILHVTTVPRLFLFPLSTPIVMVRASVTSTRMAPTDGTECGSRPVS